MSGRHLASSRTPTESGVSPASVTSAASASRQSRKRSQASLGSPGDLNTDPTERVNRRRSRKTTRACDHCKSKKLKCSGNLPCEGCSKRRLTCVYDSEYRRGRPPTPPPAETPLSASSSRLPVIPSEEHPSRPRNVSAQPSRESTTASRDHSHEGNHTASRASPELESTVIEGQYFDPTSSLTFLHRAWNRLSSQDGQPGPVPTTLNGTEQHQVLICAGDKPFAVEPGQLPMVPDLATSMELLEYYFESCVITYRCLHRGYVTEWLRTVVSNQEANLPLYYGIGHAKASVVFTIFAIVSLRRSKIGNGAASGVISDEPLRHSDPFFCVSTQMTDAEVGFPTLESAQSRILQVLYLLQSARMNQAWYVFGSSLPIVSALGLHRKSGRNRANGAATKAHHYDFITSQCRKRTFWVAYSIDKYLAVVFGRPRLYHDEDIDQEFPECVNDEDMTPQGRAAHEPQSDCHIDSLISHAKIAQLIDKISKDVYSIKKVPKHERLDSARKLGQAVHEWRKALPHHLNVRPSSLNPTFKRQAIAMKLAYCHAIMHANRPFLLGATEPRKQGENTALQDSVRECINAARTALETVDSMCRDGSLFHALWWTPYVTFCALAVVYVWEIQQIQTQSYESHGLHDLLGLAEKCQAHLARATAQDSPARRYSIILEELRQEAKNRTTRAPWRGQRPVDQDVTPTGQGVAAHEADADQSSLRSRPFANGGQGIDMDIDQAVFDGGNGFFGTGLLDTWETNDWLDLDSSAFGPFPGFDSSPTDVWMPPPV
ncbi:fungal specific transcription factor domain-containing protein [Sarocladium implicatum]|nr:fungal specific transcription factor domain-containing protein [Sarocladium implicatum]